MELLNRCYHLYNGVFRFTLRACILNMVNILCKEMLLPSITSKTLIYFQQFLDPFECKYSVPKPTENRNLLLKLLMNKDFIE